MQHELKGLWAQYYSALVICRNTMAPVFLVTVLGSYFWAKVSVSASQSIAYSGLLLALVLCLVMGSYAIVLVPFLVIANFIEHRVFDHGRNAVLNSRLATMALLGVALGAYYGIVLKL